MVVAVESRDRTAQVSQGVGRKAPRYEEAIREVQLDRDLHEQFVTYFTDGVPTHSSVSLIRTIAPFGIVVAHADYLPENGGAVDHTQFTRLDAAALLRHRQRSLRRAGAGLMRGGTVPSEAISPVDFYFSQNGGHIIFSGSGEEHERTSVESPIQEVFTLGTGESYALFEMNGKMELQRSASPVSDILVFSHQAHDLPRMLKDRGIRSGKLDQRVHDEFGLYLKANILPPQGA